MSDQQKKTIGDDFGERILLVDSLLLAEVLVYIGVLGVILNIL